MTTDPPGWHHPPSSVRDFTSRSAGVTPGHIRERRDCLASTCGTHHPLEFVVTTTNGELDDPRSTGEAASGTSHNRSASHLLSVIVPVYNERNTLPELLERVRAQSLSWNGLGVSLEIIVLDSQPSPMCMFFDMQGTEAKARRFALALNGSLVISCSSRTRTSSTTPMTTPP
ncbi:MAG: glycosyltransferase [Chloroflexi bacterium]|nr:glycosyltransferase [Chloroflexota bacterium]